MSLFFEKRQIVIPGELLAEGDFVAGENTYKEKNQIYSQKLGLAEIEGKTVYVVAFKGPYIPRVGDVIVGQVAEAGLHGWTIDINSPYYATLSVSDVLGKAFSPKVEALTSVLGIGDIVVGKVVAFDRTRDPALTIQGPGLGKVGGGLVVDISPMKVPRVIGRRGSMAALLKQQTSCDITVGQNGKILIKGKSPAQYELLISAIKLIESEAHVSGLTDKVKAFIESEKRRVENVKQT